MAAKHPLGIHRRPSIRQRRRHPLRQSIRSGGHDTLSSKASAKEKASDNDGKASVKEESDNGKASASNDASEIKCSGTTNAMEHRST
jgi:hypothetical protein